MEIIFGPMFSGKSTELIRRTKRLQSINNNVLVVNSLKDSRCADLIQTHDRKSIEAIKVDNLKELYSLELENYKVIAIDEAQFFDDLVEVVLQLINYYNLKVLICGLISDFKQQKFGHLLDLIPLADKVDKLSGYCSICCDTTEGHFTIRKKKINIADQELVGDHNEYLCVCRKHLT